MYGTIPSNKLTSQKLSALQFTKSLAMKKLYAQPASPQSTQKPCHTYYIKVSDITEECISQGSSLFELIHS